jgi:hypothetical protein
MKNWKISHEEGSWDILLILDCLVWDNGVQFVEKYLGSRDITLDVDVGIQNVDYIIFLKFIHLSFNLLDKLFDNSMLIKIDVLWISENFGKSYNLLKCEHVEVLL